MSSRRFRSKDIRGGDLVKLHPDWSVPGPVRWPLAFSSGPGTEVKMCIPYLKVKVDWGEPELPEWMDINDVELLKRP